MLTKKLTFDSDVLDVIQNMTWEDDGKLGIINSGVLDRNLYTKVNKALEAMGGKWNRSKKGHVFMFDPRPSVDGLLDSGIIEVEKDGFFETPVDVQIRMFDLSQPEGCVLEPSAGMGAIARNILLRAKVQLLTLVERNEQKANALRSEFCSKPDSVVDVYNMDFMDFNDFGYDRVYMNPPFEQGQDMDHVRHAYGLINVGGILVSVMSEHAFFASDKKATEFRDWMKQVGMQNEALPDNSFRESGTNVNTRLVFVRR